ncbi:hypothetical protein HanRHA438_Chr11g0511101 [Helianthus annuus]|uniref:Uncharacterized protein n=1 Tax=Helianthus annuus TaxID=4232 RepID=A0A9K3N0J4_HELAN|nr:hypothetical protein HanXRQr2_Chr11g0498441 [Helianthus annuus]KAJ0510085.1 hypothetical protein HanIR_Chr11g0536651 [Helianthus annuus]KAJ0871330.1 hypothetical protein HanRHA438_Chr11g0511101 [Helianthus annuus]
MEGLILPNCERLSINLRCREFQKEKKKKERYVCVWVPWEPWVKKKINGKLQYIDFR